MGKKALSILMACGYFAMFFVVQVVVSIPVMIIKGPQALFDSNVAAVLTVISNLISITCFMLITKFRKQSIKEEYYLSGIPVLIIVIIIVTGVLLNIFVSFLLSYLTETFTFIEKSMEDYAKSFSVLTDLNPTIYVIFAVILAPVMEEFIFRGGIYRVVRNECSFITAAFVSSCFFGVAHGNLIWSTYAFLLGVILCAVYEKYHSIAADISLHLSFNLASLFIEKILSDGTALRTSDYIIGTVSGVIAVILLLVLFIGKNKKQEQSSVLTDTK